MVSYQRYKLSFLRCLGFQKINLNMKVYPFFWKRFLLSINQKKQNHMIWKNCIFMLCLNWVKFLVAPVNGTLTPEQKLSTISLQVTSQSLSMTLMLLLLTFSNDVSARECFACERKKKYFQTFSYKRKLFKWQEKRDSGKHL